MEDSVHVSMFIEGFYLTDWIPFANIPTDFKRFRRYLSDD
jgi:hypothetical protein